MNWNILIFLQSFFEKADHCLKIGAENLQDPEKFVLACKKFLLFFFSWVMTHGIICQNKNFVLNGNKF